MKRLRFVGLDVHAKRISVSVVEADGEERGLGEIANRKESIGQKRPDASPTSFKQALVAPRPAAGDGRAPVDAKVHEVGE